FDLDAGKFRSGSDLISGNHSFPLQSLFDITAFFSAIKPLPEKYQSEVKALHSKFNNYEVPIVTITKRSKTEVGTIFERINNTGTDLSTLDLMVAWTWSEDFHLQEKITELLEVLEGKEFSKLPQKTILQCLSAVLQESTSTKAILALDPKQVHGEFEGLSSSMEKAIDFLATQLNATEDFLPHVQQLIPLTYFFSQTNAASAKQTSWLRQWFWKTTFSRRYAAQTDEKMDSDIQLFKQFVSGTGDGLNKYGYTVTPDQLIKQTFTRNSPLV